MSDFHSAAPVTELTSENYFSPENELFYMGSSQFKNFQKCEAAALAELRGASR